MYAIQDHIVSWINENQVQHAVVAGAGFVGLEMVEQLVHRKLKVTLVEMMPQILGPMDEEMAAYLHRDLEQRGVNVIVGDGIKEFQEDPANPHVASILTLQSGRVLGFWDSEYVRTLPLSKMRALKQLLVDTLWWMSTCTQPRIPFGPLVMR